MCIFLFTITFECKVKEFIFWENVHFTLTKQLSCSFAGFLACTQHRKDVRNFSCSLRRDWMSKLLRSLQLYWTGLLVPFKYSAPLTTSGIFCPWVYIIDCFTFWTTQRSGNYFQQANKLLESSLELISTSGDSNVELNTPGSLDLYFSTSVSKYNPELEMKIKWKNNL